MRFTFGPGFGRLGRLSWSAQAPCVTVPGESLGSSGPSFGEGSGSWQPSVGSASPGSTLWRGRGGTGGVTAGLHRSAPCRREPGRREDVGDEVSRTAGDTPIFQLMMQNFCLSLAIV